MIPSWIRVDIVGDQYKITDMTLTRDFGAVVKTVPKSELPQWILEAISLLDLCEENTPLLNVGERLHNKLGQTCYHIIKKFCLDEGV